ncbi:cytochrome P450 4d2-like [Anopheles bellator]|uniref:cytochrome P450 4d2-like n=1 Tax=Anopheles bellator TaxID=139047 RepID=UPI0026479C4D|nr:cytochrome P450 4d2-like [Anopheles bellator]
MSIFLVLLLVILLILHIIVKVFLNRRRAEKLLKQLPDFKALPSVPLLGSALLFKNTSPDGVQRTLVDFHRQYGKNLLLQELCNGFKLLVSEPRVVEQVIQAKTIRKPSFYDFFKPWLGISTVIACGQQWSIRRKLIDPVFNYKMLEDFLEVMIAHSDVLVATLAPYVGGDDFDIYNPIRYCTMDIICETAMGVQLHCQSNPTGQFIAATDELIDLIHKRVFDPLRGHSWVYPLTSAGRRMRKMVKVLHKFTDDVVRERKLLRCNGAPRRTTVLDMLLETRPNGHPFPEDDIRGEVGTFMFAGHETTTSCLSFALYYLSRYPVVQQKVYDEIGTVYAGAGDLRKVPLSYASLNELRYLDLVIKETLRISPPAPMVGRCSAGDMIIDGIPIPAGTEVMLNIFVMQTDPEFFPEPDVFCPERFAGQNNDSTGTQIMPYSYIPFSAGLRSCMGQRYAMIEMKTVLVKLLIHYRVLPSSEEKVLKVKADITLKPHGGAFIKLLPR